jgi:hypothetical protein
MSLGGRPSARRRAMRDALTGMDGERLLRGALDEVHKLTDEPTPVFVNNGRRGPNIIDTRAFPPGGWFLEGLIPTGVVAAIADLDDPSPQTLLDGGIDAVLLLEQHGTLPVGEHPVISVHFHPRLGLTAPPRFRVRLTKTGLKAVAEEEQ